MRREILISYHIEDVADKLHVHAADRVDSVAFDAVVEALAATKLPFRVSVPGGTRSVQLGD